MSVGVAVSVAVAVSVGVAVSEAVGEGVAVGVLVGSEAMESDCDPLNAAAVAQAVTSKAMAARRRFNNVVRGT